MRHSLRALLGALLLVVSSFGAHAQQSTPDTYRIAIHVSENNPATMKLALNNTQNTIKELQKAGKAFQIEVVAYGPGLHMLRQDTSPVKDRIAAMVLAHPGISFTACENTLTNQSKQENKPIKLISEAHMTPSGVVRLVELQRKGYAYLKP